MGGDRPAGLPHADEVMLGGRTTVRDMLFDAERRLAAVGVSSPSVDAAEIVAHVLGTTRSRLFLSDRVDPDQRLAIEKLLARRLTRVPLQHLTGVQGFRRIDVAVGPGVFIPRPETELVTEAGIRELAEQPRGARIAVDLCAGSAAISLSLALEAPGARVYGVEVSDEALTWARRNVDAYDQALVDVGSRVELVAADARSVADPGQPLARLAGQVAVVVTNPPYIPDQMIPREPEVRDHEPRQALFGGPDGLDVVRPLLRTAAILLRPGGLLVVEHADVQGNDAGALGVPGLMKAMAADHDLAVTANIPVGQPVWSQVADRLDLARRPRFTVARRAS